MNKITYTIIGLIILAVIGFGILNSNTKQNIPTIRIADPQAIGGALIHIALEKGYFTDQGIKVEVTGVQTGDEAVKALVTNSVDVALGGIIPYSFLALDNQTLKIMATNAYAHDNQVIANKDKGIRTAQDLKGKKIAYTKTTASDIGIQQFLEANSLSINDVDLIDMKPLAMAGALASGQVDAYTSWEPHILNGQKLLGDKALVFNEEGDIYTWHQALMAKDTYIQSHKEELSKFIKALKQAEDFAKTNPEQAIELAAKHNKISVDVLTKIWTKYEFSIKIGDDLPTILTTDLAWANNQRANKVDKIPSPSELIDPSVLQYATK